MEWCRLDHMGKFKEETRRMPGSPSTLAQLVETCQMQTKMQSIKDWWFSLAVIKLKTWYPDNQPSMIFRDLQTPREQIIPVQLVVNVPQEVLVWKTNSMLFMEEVWVFKMEEMDPSIILLFQQAQKEFWQKSSRISITDKPCKTKITLITWIKLTVIWPFKEEEVVPLT